MFKSFAEYRSGRQEQPKEQVVWHLYGVGLENLGKQQAPEVTQVAAVGPDQLLARVDAAGLCFSDTKIIKLGGDHPRLYGRNLADDPIIPGHEAALTIIAVGENRRDDYKVGDRFVVQADIYFKGVNLAFGYMLPGALEQYVLLGEEILAGDDGVYMVPLQSETGYSEAALAEPWACVVRAYRDVRRTDLKAGGAVWVVGTPGADEIAFRIPYGDMAVPRRVVLTDVPEPPARDIRDLANSAGVPVIVTASMAEIDPPALVEEHTGGKGFDDVFILGSGSTEVVEAADRTLSRGGRLNLITDKPFPGPANLDVGRIHYDDTYYSGASPDDALAAYRKLRPIKLQVGGKTWLVGGAGPMGQMHLQLALESSNRPAVIVVSDIDDERLATALRRFESIADENDVTLIGLNPTQMSPEEFDQKLREVAPDGFDDIVTMAAIPVVISQAAAHLADNGMFNVFAGAARGTTAALDVTAVALRGVRYTGSSGSGIEDLATTIRMAESRELSTNGAVAGIGGMEATWDGMEAVRDGTFPGKIVIYPQVRGLALTRLEDLAEVLPEVAEKLGPMSQWTQEAEEALIEHFLVEG
jgi:L-sorbose 1-phosphate reductase